MAKIGVTKIEETASEDRFGSGVKALVAGKVGGRDRGDLLERVLRVAVVIENRAVVEDDAVEWIERNDFHVFTRARTAAGPVRNPFAASDVSREVGDVEVRLTTFEGEKLLDKMRNRQHRRPHIECIAIDPTHRRSTSGAVEFLDDDRPKPQAL